MHLRFFCLFLPLSLASGVASAATGPQAPQVPPAPRAEMNLVASKGRISTLPIDVEALARQLCKGGVPAKSFLGTGPRNGSKSKCSITPTFELGFEVADRGAGLALTAHRFRSAVTVETPCGIWDATLALDPARPQPVSPMVFQKLAHDPRRGGFAGVLRMDTRLHLANRNSGQTADFPLRLGVGLSTLESADSDEGDECIPMSVIESEHLDIKELLAEGCTICPDDDPAEAP